MKNRNDLLRYHETVAALPANKTHNEFPVLVFSHKATLWALGGFLNPTLARRDTFPELILREIINNILVSSQMS